MTRSQKTVQAQDTIEAILKATKPVIARQGGGCHVALTVSPKLQQPASRRPVAIAIALDRSGSMSHEASSGRRAKSKLAFAQQAAQLLVDQLGDADIFGLVSFETAVSTDFAPEVMTAAHRQAAKNAIAAVRTGNSTYLEGGLKEAIRLLTKYTSTHSCKVVLISDGLANVGERSEKGLTTIAWAATSQGITVSTLGVGLEYASGMMAAIADSGSGEFTHVEDPAGMEEVFRKELAATLTLAARNLVVTVSAGDKLGLSDNLNSYPQEDAGAGIKVQLGDVFRTKELFFELTTPVALGGKQAELEALLEYEDSTGAKHTQKIILSLPVVTTAQAAKAVEDSELVARVMAVLKAKALADAAASYDLGDHAGASAALRSSVAAMSTQASWYSGHTQHLAGVAASLSVLDSTSEEMMARRLDRRTTKAMYAVNHSTTRSRSEVH